MADLHKPHSVNLSPDAVRERARRNIERFGIPVGTDNPTLLGLGAAPLPDVADRSRFDQPEYPEPKS